MADKIKKTQNAKLKLNEIENTSKNPQNKKKKAPLKKKKRKRGKWILLLIFALLSIVAGMLWQNIKPLYTELSEKLYDGLVKMDESTFKRSGNTEIYDTNGKLIGQLGNEKYTYISIQEIPVYITKGYISVDDGILQSKKMSVKGTGEKVLFAFGENDVTTTEKQQKRLAVLYQKNSYETFVLQMPGKHAFLKENASAFSKEISMCFI